MLFNIHDIVTRKKYNNDILFEILDIKGNICYLRGINLRLYADSNINDLVKVDSKDIIDDTTIIDRYIDYDLDRDNYFYISGVVLHFDQDKNFIDRCMNFYKKNNVTSIGVLINNDEIDKIDYYLKEINPNIVVITGHDAKVKDKYQNSDFYIEAVKRVRLYEKDHDKLIVIAGACQSDYEALIKAGATFASSPKRVNIHALDPAIIATSIALTDNNKTIDLLKILSKTKYGSDGIGGIVTKGTMYVGYPR